MFVDAISLRRGCSTNIVSRRSHDNLCKHIRRHNEYEISMGMTGRNASGIGPSPEQMALCYTRLSCFSIYF